MGRITTLCGNGHPQWAADTNTAFTNTLLTAAKRHEDDIAFLLTGNIPAMWLWDSTTQVRPYLVIAKDNPDLTGMTSGLVKKQFSYINLDPCANVFNEEANNAGYQDDETQMNPWVWE